MTSHEARFDPGQFDPDAPQEVPGDTPGSTESGGPEGPEGPGRGRAAVGAAGAAIREFVVVVAMALALSFVVKTWLIQAFYIPSGSMEDTLILNDRVIVNKLVPDVVDLQRGDIIVFEDPGEWLSTMPEVSHGPIRDGVERVLSFVGLLPNTSDNHLIKRVIGLPGDHIVCCDAQGRLTVNGVPISEPYVKPDVASSITFDITVPEGKVWVMGDHRSDSEDSRFHDPSGTGAEGSVPIDRITGRAVALVWPFDRAGWLGRSESTFADVPAPGASSPASPSPSGTSSGTSSTSP
ncbi:signal peptidase I [Knoellia subterranea]|uniref:Signal peptidase I n=1 Tax=Knoellia subterranea KCTC 19937 TaxID=1385521 RepID=A0A0A0JHZ3_9MICO|nr:signal peptidase I [Knoellia subterranea]KGN36748.1 signal peptidase I [Knoellia subterranea KCTC 19937]